MFHDAGGRFVGPPGYLGSDMFGIDYLDRPRVAGVVGHMVLSDFLRRA
jgi:hypothetical protein